MTQQLKFDGSTVQEAIEKANRHCGSGAKVVFAQRIKSKRALGFLTKTKYEIVVEPKSSIDLKTEVDNKTFAEELRDVLSVGVYGGKGLSKAEERFRVRSKGEGLRRYQEYGLDVIDNDAGKVGENLTPYNVDQENSTADKKGLGAVIYKRNGKRQYLEEVARPKWILQGEAVEGSSLDDAETTQPLLSEPWTNAIESRNEAKVIDLTRGRVAYRADRDEAFKEEDLYGVDSQAAKGAIAIRRLHELPKVKEGSLVVLTSCSDKDPRRSVSVVGNVLSIRQDRRIFLQGPFDSTMSEEPTAILAALRAGESVLVMARSSTVRHFKEVFPRGRLFVVAEINAGQSLSKTMSQLSNLGRVDAVSIVNLSSSADPMSLTSLGLPIVAVDGQRSTVDSWLDVITSKRNHVVR